MKIKMGPGELLAKQSDGSFKKLCDVVSAEFEIDEDQTPPEKLPDPTGSFTVDFDAGGLLCG